MLIANLSRRTAGQACFVVVDWRKPLRVGDGSKRERAQFAPAFTTNCALSRFSVFQRRLRSNSPSRYKFAVDQYCRLEFNRICPAPRGNSLTIRKMFTDTQAKTSIRFLTALGKISLLCSRMASPRRARKQAIVGNFARGL